MSVERRGTKALELWAKNATKGYVGVSVENMTTSWRNGLAFCALIHHFRPEIIEFDTLKAEHVLENNALAYRVAEQHLGIPALLDAEDMLESLVPDRLSILTYVSQFYQAFGAPSVIKSPKGVCAVVSPPASTKTISSPLTPQKTPPACSPSLATARAKLTIVPAKKEADFKTDKEATGPSKVKREECFGCQKPVFIAERILVGSPIQLRHRTCFRCARCTAQLTLANYYITEKGQFCCETCPDEEKSLSSSECSTSKTGVEFSSESESVSSDDSVSVSLSSAADHSITSDIVAPKPRTVFLNETVSSQIAPQLSNSSDVSSQKTQMLDKSDDCLSQHVERAAANSENLQTFDNIDDKNLQNGHSSFDNIAGIAIEVTDLPPQKPARSNLTADPTTITEESPKPPENCTVLNRLKFFEEISQQPEHSTDTTMAAEPELSHMVEKHAENTVFEEIKVEVPTIKCEEEAKVVAMDEKIINFTLIEPTFNSIADTTVVETRERPDDEISTTEVVSIPTDIQETEDVSLEKADESGLEKINAEEHINTKMIYPDDLNPFGSDGEEEDTTCNKSLNPFGSSDEEETTNPGKMVEISANTHNPFSSKGNSYRLDFPQTPSKTKSPPPRPPPPTLKRNEVPHGKIPSMYSSNVENPKSYPSSPALSMHTSEGATLRIKKKHKPAPIPPSLVNRSPQLDKNMKKCLNDNKMNISKEDCDEVLCSKIEKEKRNQSSKLNESSIVLKPASKKQSITITKFETGEWRRKKGQAPSRPVPQKRSIRALPMNQIQLELCDIEVKHVELERQGVIMETLIRSKTEKPDETESLPCSAASELDKSSTMSSEASHPGVEVEDLILQLFELVNEKNELFRRQTELMYLKREKRLEEEHAELEYEIRCSILKPDRTEAEIRHEEELIARMMKVIEQRDLIVNCLELERQREAVEDESIATHMIKYQEKYIEGIDSNEETKQKKKKKKLRLLKKKKKKSDREPAEDADKDIDETEVKVVKKKKKKWFKKLEPSPS